MDNYKTNSLVNQAHDRETQRNEYETNKSPLKELKGSPEFYKMINEISELHSRKQSDYAHESNPFSNFERASELISWFELNIDKQFVALIGTKLARLAELLQTGKVAKNEPIEDSFLDLATYCLLWGAHYRNATANRILDSKSTDSGKPSIYVINDPMYQNKCAHCGAGIHLGVCILGTNYHSSCYESLVGMQNSIPQFIKK